jgi:hypothetical protein
MEKKKEHETVSLCRFGDLGSQQPLSWSAARGCFRFVRSDRPLNHEYHITFTAR